MSLLPSFYPQSNVAVIGAGGGLGRAFVDILSADENVGTVHACARKAITWREQNVRAHQLDLADEDSIAAVAEAASGAGPLDLVIVATGILHRGDEIQPEKTMRELDGRALQEVFLVNAVGPALVAKHFLPRLRRGHKTVFAALSARVGSISDNRLGGWASYRASKAALNMLIRTLAIEQARVRPDAIVVALHPGTVDTRLSQPFTGRTEPGKLFAPAESAARLLRVVEGLDQEQTGGFLAYDGTTIGY
jgi:NAD(P)-dependent dehydrogenase (short-subunit alcohol dehydrogenase family)